MTQTVNNKSITPLSMLIRNTILRNYSVSCCTISRRRLPTTEEIALTSNTTSSITIFPLVLNLSNKNANQHATLLKINKKKNTANFLRNLSTLTKIHHFIIVKPPTNVEDNQTKKLLIDVDQKVEQTRTNDTMVEDTGFQILCAACARDDSRSARR